MCEITVYTYNHHQYHIFVKIGMLYGVAPTIMCNHSIVAFKPYLLLLLLLNDFIFLALEIHFVLIVKNGFPDLQL